MAAGASFVLTDSLIGTAVQPAMAIASNSGENVSRAGTPKVNFIALPPCRERAVLTTDEGSQRLAILRSVVRGA